MVSKKYQAGVNLVLKNWYQGRNCIRFGRSGNGISGYSIKMVSISLFFGIGKKLSQKKFQNGDVMRDKELLTLTEISVELGINYRTLIDFKNHFRTLLPYLPDGKNEKYISDTIDFFRLIFAMREEGYGYNLIKQTLFQQVELPQNTELRQWIESWLKEYGAKWLQKYQENITGTRMDMDGLRGTKMDRDGLGCVEMDVDGGGWIGMDTDGGNGMEQDGDGGERMYQKNNEQGLDKETKIANLKSELQSQLDDLEQKLTAQIDQQIKDSVQSKIDEVLAVLENCLLNLGGQINGSLTGFYKAIEELQEEVGKIDQRLSKLESDLTGESTDQVNLSQLDLSELQIKVPSIELATEDQKNDEGPDQVEQVDFQADLEFVKNSIYEGKPDKGAVAQWIWAEKKREPNISYGELANRLNDAGIPTLSGREEWNRGVVRNLAVKNYAYDKNLQ